MILNPKDEVRSRGKGDGREKKDRTPKSEGRSPGFNAYRHLPTLAGEEVMGRGEDCGKPRLLPIDFPPMANRQQINFSAIQVETVNDAIVAHTQAIFVQTCHAIVRKRGQPQTHGIDFLLNQFLNRIRQPEKIAVEFLRRDLGRRAVH